MTVVIIIIVPFIYLVHYNHYALWTFAHTITVMTHFSTLFLQFYFGPLLNMGRSQSLVHFINIVVPQMKLLSIFHSLRGAIINLSIVNQAYTF